MSPRVDETVRRLLVTGPARDALFERFSRLFAGRADVAVTKDRRYAERRAGGSPVGLERRVSDRRHRAPDWVVPPDSTKL